MVSKKLQNRGLSDPRRGFLDRLGGTLTEPIHTFDQMLDEGASFREALVVVALTFGIIGGIVGFGLARLASSALTFIGPWAGGAIPPQVASQLFLILPAGLALLIFLCVFVFWVVSSAIAHLCARGVFGGGGSYGQLLTLQGYAATPFFLAAVGLALGWWNAALLPYTAFLGLTAVFWPVLLSVIAVERSHRISFGRAFVSAFIAPLLVYLVILMGLGWATPVILGGFWG